MATESVHSAPTSQISSAKAEGDEARDLLQRLVSAVELAPMVAIQSFDRSGKVCLWNATSSIMYGIKAPQALGKRLGDLLLHGDREAEFAALVERIWTNGQAELPQEWRVRTKDGKEVWVYSTLFPVFRGQQVHQIFCMDVDITERKETELALTIISANYRALFDASGDGIFLIKDDVLVEVNPMALRLFGESDKNNLLRRRFVDLSPPTQSDGTPSEVSMKTMLNIAQEHQNHRFVWLFASPATGQFMADVSL